MKTPKANAGLGVGWLQLATYPQSPFSGPVGCCDVTDLYQAFRAAHRPGAIMDKSERPFCPLVLGTPQDPRSIPDILHKPTTQKHVTFNPQVLPMY